MEEETRTENKIELLIGNCSPPSSSRLTPCQAPSKRWLTYINPPHFPFYHWAWHCEAWSASLVSLGHLPSSVPSQPHVGPVYPLDGGRVHNCRHCSAALKVRFGQKCKHGTRSSAMQKFNSVPAEISAHVKAVSILCAKKVSQGHPESHNSGKQHQISTQEQPA